MATLPAAIRAPYCWLVFQLFVYHVQIDWGSAFDVEPMIADDNAIDFDIDVEDIGIVLETTGEASNGNGHSDDNGFELVSQEEMQNWELEEVFCHERRLGPRLRRVLLNCILLPGQCR